MTSTAEALLTEFTGLYAETHKDEISVLIPKDYTQFNRDGAKLSTLAASTAASAFSLQYGERVQFDVEIYAMFSEDTIYDYFRWRQADACRFAIFSHAVSQLKRAKKISQEKAEKYLKGFSTQQCLQLLENLKFNMNSNTPLWHRRGSGLFWRLYFKSGINPTTNKVLS